MSFIDLSELDKNQKFYWHKRAIDSLRQSFDYVKEARERMQHTSPNRIIDPELEQLLQVAGSVLMETAKKIKAFTEPQEEKVEKPQ